MKPINNNIRDEEPAAPMMNNPLILGSNDCYTCTSCPCSVEILSINDKENTLTFKCLNPIEEKNHNIQTIQISEYINLIKKYTYLYSECSICKKLQNQSKDIPIFSYCIKCDKVICNDCINEHLQSNEKNHQNMSKEYIIKNNEKNIKCLEHPTEKNIAYCFDCNIHLCNKCLKNRKHLIHRKNAIIDVKPNEKMIEKLNGIINIYKEKIKILNKGKEKKELELFNKLKENIKKVKEEKENKIKEAKSEIQKEIVKNEKELNDDLYALKINYENEVKLRKNKYNFIVDNENKKYKQLEEFYNFKTNEELDKIKKEYNEEFNNLEYNKKIKNNENLLLVNNIIKNTHKNYGDNYYNNFNINNIIYNYYKSEDPLIKELLNNEDEIHDQLINIEEEERKYKLKNAEIGQLKIEIIKTLKDENEKIKNENNEKINIIKNLKEENEKIKKENNEKLDIIKALNDEIEKISNNNKENIEITKTLKNENEQIKNINIENIEIIKNLKNKIEKSKNEIPEKYICKIKIDKYIGYGFLCNIPDHVLVISDNTLKKEDIEIGKEIIILFNNGKISKKIKINEDRNISIIDKLDDKEVNIVIIELNKKEEEIENQKFFEFKLFENVINKYLKNEIIITLNIEKEDINNNIYFLDNTDDEYFESGKKIMHKHDNLREINENNTKLYINNKQEIFKKYFIPKEIGNYEIKLKFKIKLKNCRYMFCGCEKITKINLSLFNTQNTTNMSRMFYGCKNLTYINLSSFCTKNVTTMGNMFALCNNLTNINVSSFNTENVISMHGMFWKCSNLTKINLSSFNTKNLVKMSYMFSECGKLKDVNLTSFDTHNIKEMEGAFDNCSNLTVINLSGFYLQNINNIEGIFNGCDDLKEIIINKNSMDKIQKQIPKSSKLIIK